MIKIFQSQQLADAIAHAVAGGQSIHLHRVIPHRDKAPRCFVAAVDRGEHIAHFFDQNQRRLVTLCQAAGVKVIVVERKGTERQHVDLCGGPLHRLLQLANTPSLFEGA